MIIFAINLKFKLNLLISKHLKKTEPDLLLTAEQVKTSRKTS